MTCAPEAAVCYRTRNTRASGRSTACRGRNTCALRLERGVFPRGNHARHTRDAGASGEKHTCATRKRRCVGRGTHLCAGSAGVLSDEEHTCVRPEHSVSWVKHVYSAPGTPCLPTRSTPAPHPRRRCVGGGIRVYQARRRCVAPGTHLCASGAGVLSNREHTCVRAGAQCVVGEHACVASGAQACQGRRTCASHPRHRRVAMRSHTGDARRRCVGRGASACHTCSTSVSREPHKRVTPRHRCVDEEHRCGEAAWTLQRRNASRTRPSPSVRDRNATPRVASLSLRAPEEVSWHWSACP